MSSILIVEDSASVPQSVRIALSGHGHSVNEATTAEKLELIITGLNMPVVEGLSMIRRCLAKRKVKFIVVPNLPCISSIIGHGIPQAGAQH
jgi:CheY-like chemotaxis protein